MNEKLQYAKMIEIPFSTVNVTYKPARKRRIKKLKKEPKEMIIEKINRNLPVEESDGIDKVIEEKIQNSYDMGEKNAFMDIMESKDGILAENKIPDNEDYGGVTVRKKQKDKRFRINAIAVELIVMGLLLATIIATNILMPQSGINRLLTETFSTEKAVEEVKDARLYSDFSLSVPVKDVSAMSLSDGVITCNGKGSVYSPCEGKIKSVAKTGDGYNVVEIMHNDNFSTVISGLKFVYFSEGETVLSNIPVGYYDGESSAKVSFIGNDGINISDFNLEDGKLTWAA